MEDQIEKEEEQKMEEQEPKQEQQPQQQKEEQQGMEQDQEQTEQQEQVQPMVPETTHSYTYTKKRSEFGRQCIFNDSSLNLCEINSDDKLKKQFKRARKWEQSVQHCQQMAEDEVETEDANLRHIGVCHNEGGFPNVIDLSNEAAKNDYKKVSIQNAEYKTQMKTMCVKMEHKIAQNNAVNIFFEYFTEEHEDCGRSYKPEIESIAFFENPHKNNIFDIYASHSSIAPQSHDKMAVSYTEPPSGKMNTFKHGISSYIWDLTRNLEPILELQCESALSILEYNDKDEMVIAAGQSDGIVSLYDARIGGKAQLQSIGESSHQESVSGLRWIMSKQNNEFFTCANDAQVMWWDIRRMETPYEYFKLDLNTAGCSTLDYTFSMPTRFLVGTTDGRIINGNKRGLTYADRFPFVTKSFSGPVHTAEKNPFADKYSLVVGDQSIHFWSEENRETPIFQTIEYPHDLTCGTWNRNRCSNYFIGHETGTIDMWDYLYDQYHPIASISVVNSRVEHIRSHPNGRLLAGSFRNGDIYLMQISKFLSKHKVVEKSSFIGSLDRELGREMNFLSRIREQRMMMAQRKDDKTTDDPEKSKIPTVEETIAACVKDFEDIIEKETKPKTKSVAPEANDENEEE